MLIMYQSAANKVSRYIKSLKVVWPVRQDHRSFLQLLHTLTWWCPLLLQETTTYKTCKPLYILHIQLCHDSWLWHRTVCTALSSLWYCMTAQCRPNCDMWWLYSTALVMAYRTVCNATSWFWHGMIFLFGPHCNTEGSSKVIVTQWQSYTALSLVTIRDS